MRASMKKLMIFALCALAASCSSPVEKYIANDFSRVVREEGLQEEIQEEVKRWSSLLGEMASEANPEAKEAKELAAKAKKMEQELKTRVNNYNRTGNYSYIINIANDADNCDAMAAKAERLANKARPYEKHKEAQIKAFAASIEAVDAVSLMSASDLAEDSSVDAQFVFNHIIGVPENKVTASKETLDSIATIVLTNYFISHPTPTVKAHKYQKDEECWYITLTDDTHYYLSAIKCDNGEYDYEYQKTEGSMTLSTKSSGKKKGGNRDIDKFLDDYEKFVTSFAKSYKKLYKKSLEGDMSVLLELQKLSAQAEEFEDRYDSLEDNFNAKQIQRYEEITLKLASVTAEIMMEE